MKKMIIDLHVTISTVMQIFQSSNEPHNIFIQTMYKNYNLLIRQKYKILSFNKFKIKLDWLIRIISHFHIDTEGRCERLQTPINRKFTINQKYLIL